jgi:hypothetical protein
MVGSPGTEGVAGEAAGEAPVQRKVRIGDYKTLLARAKPRSR